MYGANWEYPAFKIYNSTDEDITYYLGHAISGYDVKFVALGNNATNFLKKFNVSHFKLPHPSGRNRQVNNEEFIQERLKACKEWLNA